MTRITSTRVGRDASERNTARNIVGLVIIGAITGGIAVLIGFTVRSVSGSVFTVLSVLVAGEILRYLIVRFSLPDAVFPLVAGVILFTLCAWLVLDGGSLLLAAFGALVGGWAFHDAVGSLRATETDATGN